MPTCTAPPLAEVRNMRKMGAQGPRRITLRLDKEPWQPEERSMTVVVTEIEALP
jgi:hypothetical protein